MHTPRAWQILTKMGTLSPAPEPSQAKCSSCLSQDTSVKAMSCAQPKLCTDIFVSMHGSDLNLLGLGREQRGRKWTHPSEGLPRSWRQRAKRQKMDSPIKGFATGLKAELEEKSLCRGRSSPIPGPGTCIHGTPRCPGNRADCARFWTSHTEVLESGKTPRDIGTVTHTHMHTHTHINTCTCMHTCMSAQTHTHICTLKCDPMLRQRSTEHQFRSEYHWLQLNFHVSKWLKYKLPCFKVTKVPLSQDEKGLLWTVALITDICNLPYTPSLQTDHD